MFSMNSTISHRFLWFKSGIPDSNLESLFWIWNPGFKSGIPDLNQGSLIHSHIPWFASFCFVLQAFWAGPRRGFHCFSGPPLRKTHLGWYFYGLGMDVMSFHVFGTILEDVGMDFHDLWSISFRFPWFSSFFALFYKPFGRGPGSWCFLRILWFPIDQSLIHNWRSRRRG